MTKKTRSVTLGVLCCNGKECGMRKVAKKGANKICAAPHYTELVKPKVVYTYVFDTTRPEMYMSEEENKKAMKYAEDAVERYREYVMKKFNIKGHEVKSKEEEPENQTQEKENKQEEDNKE